MSEIRTVKTIHGVAGFIGAFEVDHKLRKDTIKNVQYFNYNGDEIELVEIISDDTLFFELNGSHDEITMIITYEDHGEAVQINELISAGVWVPFNWDVVESRPTKVGKYFVTRKDGKVHWEKWNGSGWAYNGNVIVAWTEIIPYNITDD